jgi:hypothetical protein
MVSAGERSELGLVFLGHYKFDGHCPSCHRETTYKAVSVYNEPNAIFSNLKNYGLEGDYKLRCVCARDDEHKLMFFVQFTKTTATKIGQLPSLADVANDESKKYSSVLEPADSRELHTAIGLAAHGVGIGSFVYLRRIFERLVQRRFDEAKAEKGWLVEDFLRLRMNERVKFLKGHLPSFLVDNAEIYSILSEGVHALDEETCRADFNLLKASIVTILDEDRRNKERRDQEAEIAKAIKDRSSKGGTDNGDKPSKPKKG